MKKMERRKIDELFREGLGNSDEPFNEAHWNELERMMDKRKRRHKLKIAGFFLLAGAVLFLLFFRIDGRRGSSKPIPAKQEPVARTEPPKPGVFSGDLPDNTDRPVPGRPGMGSGSGRKTIPGDTIRPGNPGSVSPDTGENFYRFAKPGNASTEPDEEQQPVLTGAQDRERQTAADGGNKQNEIKAIESIPIAKDPGMSLTESTGDLVAASSAPSPEETRDEEKDPAAEETETALKQVGKDTTAEEAGKRRRIPLGLLTILAAPDLTSVQGAGKVRLSQNFGILYTQPLGKKLSLSTGVLYARKKYASAYRFYNPENPPVLSEYPTEVSAVCEVIDVPLLLNLNVLDNRKIRVNIGAGISSYFMLKEKYRFSYEGTGRYGKQDGTYEIRGQNRHVFGVADFSVSVERKISEKISVGLRPFVKVPLTGIGYGQIRLESKGIAVTMGLDLKGKTP